MPTSDFGMEKEKLKQAVEELSALNQIANAINSYMLVPEITKVMIDLCLSRTGASQGAVYMIEEEMGKTASIKTFYRQLSRRSDEPPLRLTASLTGWMMKNKTTMVSNDVGKESSLSGLGLSDMGITSLVMAPLISQHKLIGLIVLFNKKGSEGFHKNDGRFLGIVGTQAAKVIENATLHEKETELLTLQSERRLAGDIQTGFLPKGEYNNEICQICGFSIPAKDVGGDFYDIVPLKESRTFISLGDVADKGLAAALVMAIAQAVVRAQLPSATDIPLDKLATSLNQVLCHFCPPDRFTTAILGEFDCRNKTFTYINAGHPPMLVIRKSGKVESFPDGDIIFGVLADSRYHICSIKLDQGDILCLYSDGITEAFDAKGEAFGEERLVHLLLKNVKEDLPTIQANIIKGIEDFRQTAPQSDDITMVMLKVND
jgi:phosphoserine phosphatase RsbU/P